MGSQPPATAQKSQDDQEDKASEHQSEQPPAKRAPIDKQEAFLEFKQTDEGMRIDDKINSLRQSGKERR